MWYFTACRYDHECGHRYENCNEKIKKLFCADEVLSVKPDVIKNATLLNRISTNSIKTLLQNKSFGYSF